jgi:hypothetical protein
VVKQKEETFLGVEGVDKEGSLKVLVSHGFISAFQLFVDYFDDDSS